MKKFNVAVIGCGAVSKNHGKALLDSPDGVIKYCVDTDFPKAQAFSALYGGEPLQDYKELFQKADADIVHVITPHFTHPDIAIECMEHGFDVFCEKPLSINVSDGKKMIDAAERTKRHLGVCFQNRLNDSSVRAKRLLEDNVYGSIISAAATVRWDRHGAYYSGSPWRGKFETEGGGCIINQSIHTIDLLQYLTGGIKSLSAVTSHLRMSSDYEVEDSCMANFTFNCGATGVGYFTNCAAAFKTAIVEIVCEKARLKIEQKGLEITSDSGVETFESEVAVGEKSEWGLSHGKMIHAFYKSVREGAKPPVDGKEALKTVKIIAALQHSMGREIPV